MNQNFRSKIIELLHSSGCSCVIVNGYNVREFYGRGVSDLYHLLNSEPQLLSGAFVADKVVGKGAAALMILGNVAEVYTDMISDSALALFKSANIQVSYATRVEAILNRDMSGFCPVETICGECTSAEECLPLIEAFITRMNHSNKH